MERDAIQLSEAARRLCLDRRTVLAWSKKGRIALRKDHRGFYHCSARQVTTLARKLGLEASRSAVRTEKSHE
jgi:predicted site-specific integrase-resolvase